MKIRWMAWVPVFLMAGLAGLTWWLDQMVQPLTGAKDPASPSEPDFVVDNFEATRMNLDGTQRYAVVANRMVHYPGDNTAVLDHPYLTHFDPNKAPVSIRANQGVMENNGENAFFTGDVQVKRAAFGNDAEIVMYTSFLHVIPDKDLVKTDREVTFVSGNSTLKSVGLEFNNKTRELKLLSNVKGQIETPAKDHRPLPWDHRKR
jgi:lipopolysaccharide export system protein LptC